MMHLYELRVGKPAPGLEPPTQVGARYSFDGQHYLTLMLDWIRPAEVAAVRCDPCEFAVATDGPVVFLLYRFGVAIPWSDAPYSWHLQGRPEPPVRNTPEEHALIHVTLIEAETAIVRALRAVTISPAVTRALHGAIIAQSEQPWDGTAAYEAALAETYKKYSTESLLKRALARCGGGR